VVAAADSWDVVAALSIVAGLDDRDSRAAVSTAVAGEIVED
jgi:hypothetical protein